MRSPLWTTRSGSLLQSKSKTLCVILNEARAADATFESLGRFILSPLVASLAYCGAKESNWSNPYGDYLDYEWAISEPEDWQHFLADKCSGGLWASLIGDGPGFGASWSPEEVSLWKSGLIGLWFRYRACEEIIEKNLDTDFDWFCFLRSDFLWENAAPDVTHARKDKIYILQGEEYGGINDRFALVPRALLEQYRDIASRIFLDPAEDLIKAASRWKRTWGKFNPESYWLMMLQESGLESRVQRLPYLGYSIRLEGEKSRWSQGFLWPERGFYVKYPSELFRTRLATFLGLSTDSFSAGSPRLTQSVGLKVVDLFSRLAAKFPNVILLSSLRVFFGIPLVKVAASE